MKNLILTLAIFTILLASCKKEAAQAPEKNVVKYRVTCTDCTVTFDVKSGQRTERVTAETFFTDINELATINVVANGTGDITLMVTLDDIVKIYETKWLGNGTARYSIKMR